MVGDKGIAGLFTFHHRGHKQAFGEFHRYILDRMRGDVGAAFQHALFQFFDEQALATDLGQRGVQDFVALGAHGHQFDGQSRMVLLQTVFDMLGLPQGERAFTGGNTNQVFHLELSVAKWAAIIPIETRMSTRSPYE